MKRPDLKQVDITIAIADDKTGEWEYLTFATWDEARDAVNAARADGKAAVFYDGATLSEPPINVEEPISSDSK